MHFVIANIIIAQNYCNLVFQGITSIELSGHDQKRKQEIFLGNLNFLIDITGLKLSTSIGEMHKFIKGAIKMRSEDRQQKVFKTKSTDFKRQNDVSCDRQ